MTWGGFDKLDSAVLYTRNLRNEQILKMDIRIFMTLNTKKLYSYSWMSSFLHCLDGILPHIVRQNILYVELIGRKGASSNRHLLDDVSSDDKSVDDDGARISCGIVSRSSWKLYFLIRFVCADPLCLLPTY
jgi:hypothetical protein